MCNCVFRKNKHWKLLSKLITQESSRNFKLSMANMNKDLWNQLTFLTKKTVSIDRLTDKVVLNQEDPDEPGSPAKINANQIKFGIELLKQKIKMLMKDREGKPKKFRRNAFDFLRLIQPPVRMKTMYQQDAKKERIKNKRNKLNRLNCFSSSPERKNSPRRFEDLMKLTNFMNTIENTSASKHAKSEDKTCQRQNLNLKSPLSVRRHQNSIKNRILARIKSSESGIEIFTPSDLHKKFRPPSILSPSQSTAFTHPKPRPCSIQPVFFRSDDRENSSISTTNQLKIENTLSPYRRRDSKKNSCKNIQRSLGSPLLTNREMAKVK